MLKQLLKILPSAPTFQQITLDFKSRAAWGRDPPCKAARVCVPLDPSPVEKVEWTSNKTGEWQREICQLLRYSRHWWKSTKVFILFACRRHLMNLWWACDIIRPALLHIRYKDKDGDFVNLNKDDRWFSSDVCSCQFSRWILETNFEYQWATFTCRSMAGTRQKTKASRNVYSCVGNWTKARSSVIREKVCECCIIYQKSRVITIRLHKSWISQNHSVKESIVMGCESGIGQGHLWKWCAHYYLHFLIKDLWKPSQIKKYNNIYCLFEYDQMRKSYMTKTCFTFLTSSGCS